MAASSIMPLINVKCLTFTIETYCDGIITW